MILKIKHNLGKHVTALHKLKVCKTFIFFGNHLPPLRGGPLEIPRGGAKNFQCTNFFSSPSCLQDFFFFDVVGLFLDGGLLAGFLFLKIFLCRNFFSGIVTPPPMISNGLPLIYWIGLSGYHITLATACSIVHVVYMTSCSVLTVLLLTYSYFFLFRQEDFG